MQFKVATAEVAGYLNDLIDKAGEFLAELTKARGETPGGGQEKFNAIADAMAVAAKEAAGLSQDVDQLTRVIDNMVAKGGEPEIIRWRCGRRAKRRRHRAELPKVALAAARRSFPAARCRCRARGRPAPTRLAEMPRLTAAAAAGMPPDGFERATDQIEKHIVVMEAQTAATGKAMKSRAADRTRRSCMPPRPTAIDHYSEEYAEEIEDGWRQASARPAQQAADAQRRSRKSTQLGQMVGSAMSTAFADAMSEGKKLNEVLTAWSRRCSRRRSMGDHGAVYAGRRRGIAVASLFGGLPAAPIIAPAA